MEEELVGLGGGAVFEDGSLLWLWYDTFLVVPAVFLTGYLTYRTLRWYGWTGRWPLATKALSVLGTALVLLVALDRIGVDTLSMNSTVYGFGSVVGGGFATLAGLVAVVRSKLAERREGKPAGKTDAEVAALPEDVGIQGATQVFTRVRGADAWLVTRSGDETGAIVNVKGSNVAVGIQEGADIRIGDASVDPSHAIIRADQGAYTVLDLGSSAGTWVNGNQAVGATLRDGSRVSIGNSELFFSEIAQGGSVSTDEEDEKGPVSTGVLLVRSGPASGQSFKIGNDDLIVGRQPGEGGARLDDPAVSQRHLLLRPSTGACLLFDLGSSNGTAVDGADITGYPLRNGDVVKFGQAEFQFVTEDAE